MGEPVVLTLDEPDVSKVVFKNGACPVGGVVNYHHIEIALPTLLEDGLQTALKPALAPMRDDDNREIDHS